MLTVSQLPLLVVKRVCGVEISDLPYLDLGHNLNLTYEEMDDLWRQVISVKDNNGHAPQKFSTPKTFPYHNWKRRTVVYRKESFDRYDQTIYKTHTLLSRIIIVRR